VKSQKLSKFVSCGGINQVLQPNLGNAKIVLNCRLSILGGWMANIGFQSWWKSPSSWTVSTTTLQNYFEKKVDSCYQWKRQGSNDVYTIVEQNGTLYYMSGNKGQGSTYTGTFFEKDIVIIESNRYIPKLGDVSTQYINLGRHLLILNGRDRAIIFSGDKEVRDFGFVTPTPQPFPNDVSTGYTQALYLDGGTSITFEPTGVFGLGNATTDANEYSYKITCISNLGAESPLSQSGDISWQIPVTDPQTGLFKFGVVLDLPLGQEGVVARRIYRTKNIPDNGSIYYFLKQIDENSTRNYVDVLGDRMLVDEAPTNTSSTTIRTNLQFGETWDNRLWLAKGNQIIYSEQGIFEQFGALNSFDLGNLTGGDITQLKAFYNNLIVFREEAINIISFDSNGYNISTITETIGTTASNSVVVIPRLGIVFLSNQGVYLLTGGLNGGASLEMRKISQGVDEELNSINAGMIHKTVAAYSPQEKEVWFHVPTNSSTIPDTGFVLHLFGTSFQWSLRTNNTTSKRSQWSAMTTTLDGYYLLGNAPNWTISGSQTTDKFGALQVMTYSNNWGQAATIGSISDGSAVLTITDVANAGSQWKSEWYSFNENSVKIRYFSVELRVMSYGDNNFDFVYGIDYSYVENATSAQKQAKSDTVFTTKEDPVMGAVDPTTTKVPFTIGSSRLNEGRLITLRYDVNTQLCDQFKFSVQTSSSTHWHLLSFNILSDSVALPSLNQSTRVQRGQAR